MVFLVSPVSPSLMCTKHTTEILTIMLLLLYKYLNENSTDIAYQHSPPINIHRLGIGAI